MKTAVLLAGVLLCGAMASAEQGTVERIRVHGKALEGNLEGDSPDRYVPVYLPATYQTAKTRCSTDSPNTMNGGSASRNSGSTYRRSSTAPLQPLGKTMK